jgi:hypothetical protein
MMVRSGVAKHVCSYCSATDIVQDRTSYNVDTLQEGTAL